MDLNRMIRVCTSRLSKLGDWAPIPLRLIVGYSFLPHGYGKIEKGPERFFAILYALGVPDPYLTGWATILIEVLGALAVLAGAFIMLASFSSIKLLAVTAGAQFGQPGYEVDLLYPGCLAVLVLGGSGPFSVDGLLALKSRTGCPGQSAMPRTMSGP